MSESYVKTIKLVNKKGNFIETRKKGRVDGKRLQKIVEHLIPFLPFTELQVLIVCDDQSLLFATFVYII